MYGLISKIRAAPGARDDLMAKIAEQNESMPGNLSFVVAADSDEANAIWITEVWEDQASHKASLALPGVRESIQSAKHLVEGFELLVRTRPVSGV